MKWQNERETIQEKWLSGKLHYIYNGFSKYYQGNFRGFRTCKGGAKARLCFWRFIKMGLSRCVLILKVLWYMDGRIFKRWRNYFKRKKNILVRLDRSNSDLVCKLLQLRWLALVWLSVHLLGFGDFVVCFHVNAFLFPHFEVFELKLHLKS